MKELFEVTIEVTQRCPNKCIYCSSWSDLNKKDMLEFDAICGIVDDATALGAKLINISGGEPLLRPDIVKIVEYIKAKELKIRLYTSGIIFNEGYHSVPVSLLESLRNKVDTLIVNYEAESPEKYAQVMGTFPDNLQLLDKTIEDALKLGFVVEAHLVPMKCNFRTIPQTLAKVYAMGISKVSFLRLVPQGRETEYVSDTLLSDEEELELKAMLKSLSELYGDKLRLGKPYRSQKFTSCNTGTIRLAVRYDGYVFPCGAFKDGVMEFSGESPDNIRNKRLIDIYNNSRYIEKVRQCLKGYYEGEVTEPCFGQYYRKLTQ